MKIRKALHAIETGSGGCTGKGRCVRAERSPGSRFGRRARVCRHILVESERLHPAQRRCWACNQRPPFRLICGLRFGRGRPGVRCGLARTAPELLKPAAPLLLLLGPSAPPVLEGCLAVVATATLFVPAAIILLGIGPFDRPRLESRGAIVWNALCRHQQAATVHKQR